MKHHGILRARQLEQAGHGRRARERLCASGQLIRLSKGWYADADHDLQAATAVRSSGRLTCVDALKRHGVWVPLSSGTHVRIGPGYAGVLDPGIVPHRTPSPLGADPIDDVSTALECAFLCLSPRDALVVADSAVNLGLLPEDAVLRISGRGRNEVRRALRFLDGRSQSGTESVVRYELARRHWPVTPQATIPGVGEVDLLVGNRLIVECDSASFHALPDMHSYDRSRDLEAMADGFVVARLSYEMVMVTWERTWARLHALLLAGIHIDTARSRRMRETWISDARRPGTRRREWADLVPRTPSDSVSRRAVRLEGS